MKPVHKLDVVGLALLVAGSSGPHNGTERCVRFTVMLLFTKQSRRLHRTKK